MFKDLRNGSPIFILDRKEITVTQGTIVNNPVSRFDSHFGIQKMVVDIEVEISGSKQSYVVEDSLSSSYFGDKMITCSKESIVAELDSICSTSQAALKMVPYHQEAIPKCEALKREYSTEYRERTEANERMTKLENKLDDITKSLQRLFESNQKPQY